jgi:hypothetical protein
VAITGRGHVAWSFLDTKGMLRTLKLPAYYVPASGMRLLSTTSLLQHYPNEFLMGDQRGLRLSGTKPEPSPQTVSKPPMTRKRTSQWLTPSITTVPGIPVASSDLTAPPSAPTETLRTLLALRTAPRMVLLSHTASLLASVEAEMVESPTIMVIRVDTDLLGTVGALNSRVCKTAHAILTYGSAGSWDPTDFMVHQVRQYLNSNHVMTLPSHPTNRLFGRIWCIRRLLRASQPLQL